MASDGCDAATIRGAVSAIKRIAKRKAIGLLRATPMLTIVFAVGLGPCTKVRGRGVSTEPSSTPSTSSAVIASASAQAAALAAASASASAAVAAAAASAAAAGVATDRAKQQLADLKWMVAHNVTSNPAKAGEGDASTKCDAIEASRSGLASNNASSDPDSELKKVLDEASALCAFDIPCATASESLDHLQTQTSQASKLLMCNIASKETDRARAIKPRDPKVRRLDARRITACGR